MNKQFLGKIGPILGLIVSISTTSFAGYKIFAAPLEHAAVIPSLPTPTPSISDEPDEIVETVFDDSLESPTTTMAPTPTGIPTFTNASGASGTSASSFPVITRASGSDDEFEDSDDDRISIENHDSEKKEVEHESEESEEASHQ